jgi:hypothetical protein
VGSRDRKAVEPLEIFVEAWRQLVEQRPERRSERTGERDKLVGRFLAVEELLHVRDEAVDLDRVAEARRRLLAPLVEGRGKRQAVEAGVDLDRVELRSIAPEPPLLCEPFGIEGSAPVPVHPARAADVDAVGNS